MSSASAHPQHEGLPLKLVRSVRSVLGGALLSSSSSSVSTTTASTSTATTTTSTDALQQLQKQQQLQQRAYHRSSSLNSALADQDVEAAHYNHSPKAPLHVYKHSNSYPLLNDTTESSDNSSHTTCSDDGSQASIREVDEELQQPLLSSKDPSSSSSINDNNSSKSCSPNQEDTASSSTPDNVSAFIKVLWEDVLDYLILLRTNRAFRLFLCSYVFGHMGEWFTYIASISLLERMLGGESADNRTAIGVLVMIRLLPTVLLSPFGGVLADSRDRRKSMIVLDLIGACTPVLFIVASLLEHTRHASVYGVGMIYLATICQECVCALYEPCRTSIVPLLVTGNDGDLKKATTLTGVAWSAVAGFGAALGGFATSYFGARVCFCLDGCCYLISAVIMWSVGGNWAVAPEKQYESVWQQIAGMTVDGAKYLSSSFFGGLVFFKASCALVTGATNVLNVTLSEREGDTAGLEWIVGVMDTEQKLGLLFSITGIGCILGPLVADPLTNVEHPRALQLACIYGFMAVTVGCFGVGLFHPFWSVCLFSAIRSAGMGILWLDSQFLLQKFAAKEMLGRVAAVDEALATLAEALSSLMCGILQDRFQLTGEFVSQAQAFLGFVFVIVWSMYHAAGRGAACRTNSGAKVMKKSS